MTADFAGRANCMMGFGIPAGWPLVEKFAVTAAPLIARVTGMLATHHDVVQVQAGLGFQRPAEISRAPAARLAGGMVITQRGDVFKVRIPNIWDLMSGKIPGNGPSAVLVRRGEQLCLGAPGELRGEARRSYFPLQSGECLDITGIAATWRQILTAMAEALP